MTYKTLSNLAVKEALDATAGMKNWQLRDETKKLFNQHTRDRVLRARLQAILGECRRLSERRNDLIHNAWAIAGDGSAVVKSPDHQWMPAPTSEDLNQLALEITELTERLNRERLHGFIQDVVSAAFSKEK